MDILVLGTEDGEAPRAAVQRFRGMRLANPAAFLADPAGIALVALDDREVVGWAWGTRQPHVCGYSPVQLYEIAVIPTRRGLGVGRALLERFLEPVTAEGHRLMWLFTDEANVAAMRLYESAGGEPSPHDDATYWWQLGTTDARLPVPCDAGREVGGPSEY